MSDSDSSGELVLPAPTLLHVDPDNTIRILLATDNHVGYLERDPIRGQDSINTFREILQLAVKHDVSILLAMYGGRAIRNATLNPLPVDFILLAGDLFHENRPSRDCLYQVIGLLRQYTMGDKPIQVELLSDPNEGKAASYDFPAINYEDPNLNVAIPVFSIHGNHDDPQGAGTEGALCALDVLSASGLINYMGKFDLPLSEADAQTEGIAIRPVLLRKGVTHLGLYGVGNVKDQRMHFELRSNRVRMYMPRNRDDWFNILLLHQNRVRHGPQESVPEGMFDDSVDLVVWGHEHDCQIVPQPVTGKPYYITQPGSSIATSLADGESIEKHVALLQIQGKQFEIKPIPLRTVRPFVLEDVVLSEAAEEEGFELNDQIAVSKFLKSRVNALIDQANKLWDDRNARAVEDGDEPLPHMLPLVRLKVDTTGVSEMSNPIRFGQEFQGRIANPRDVLVFHRAKRTTRSSKVTIDQPELSIDDPDLSATEKLSKVRMQTLVKEYLAAQELQLLGEAGMSDAIQIFVEKDDSHAIQTHVTAALKALMKGVQANGEVDEGDLDNVLVKIKEQHETEYAERNRAGQTAKGKGKARADDSDNASVDSMMMEVDGGGSDVDFDNDRDLGAPPPPKKAKRAVATKAPAKKAPTKGRGKKVVESEGEEAIDLDSIEDDDEEPAPKPAKRTNRGAVLSQPSKKPPAKRGASSKAKDSTQSTLTFGASGRTSTRAAASRARGKMASTASTSTYLRDCQF
ncbi:Mre11 DNA-binding presumed domain-containing protein [Pisolithus marmoratus]|nr:Mre11 DNA-binding presumed domain-containing protein [Pisolithus marmoratus]